MWGDHDVPQWAMTPARDPHTNNCWRRRQLYRQRHITLEGNENYLRLEGPRLLCPQFRQILLFRSPIHRLASHVMEMKVCRETSHLCHGREETVDSIFEKWPTFSNNFYVRSLAGSEAFRANFGNVTEKHLQLARRVLHAYDDVLIVGPNLTADIHQRLGWNCSGRKGRQSHAWGGTQGVVDFWNSTWSASEWQRLLDANALDLSLWDEVVLLYGLS